MLRPWTCGRCRTANPGHVMHCSACGWSPMTQPTVMDPQAFQARPRRRSLLPALLAILASLVTVVAILAGGVWLQQLFTPKATVVWRLTSRDYCMAGVQNDSDERLENLEARATVYATENRAGFISSVPQEIRRSVGTLEPHGSGGFVFMCDYYQLHDLKLYQVIKRPEGPYDIPVSYDVRFNPMGG